MNEKRQPSRALTRRLLIVVRGDDVEAAKALLVNEGADVNTRDVFSPDQPALLHEAVNRQNADMVELLIEHKADVNITDGHGRTPLFFATWLNHLWMINCLLDAGADVRIADEEGATPLLNAAGGGNAQVAKVLIAKGADVNAVTAPGATPLTEAFSGGSVEVVRILIKNGADVNPAVLPLAKGKREEEYSFGPSPLSRAATYNVIGGFRDVLDAGADLSLRDENGCTALFHAARCNVTQTVKTLLAEGADVNASNAQQESPLYIAAKGYNTDPALLDAIVAAKPRPITGNLARHFAYRGQLRTFLFTKELITY